MSYTLGQAGDIVGQSTHLHDEGQVKAQPMVHRRNVYGLQQRALRLRQVVAVVVRSAHCEPKALSAQGLSDAVNATVRMLQESCIT